MAIINTQIKGGGVQPTGTVNIPANGIYDVSSYATADVQVPTTAPTDYIEYNLSSGTPNSATLHISSNMTYVPNYWFYYAMYNKTSSVSSITNDSITGVGQQGFSYAFNYSTGLTSVLFNGIQNVSSQKAFQYAFSGSSITVFPLPNLKTISASEGCTYICSSSQITSANLQYLTSITGSGGLQGAFNNCTNLQTFAADSITSMTTYSAMGYICQNCTKLTSFSMSGLKTVNNTSVLQSACSGCTKLTSVDLSSLETVGGSYATNGMFYNCTSLESLSLNSLVSITANNSLSGSSTLGRILGECKKLKNVYFGGLKSTTFSSLQGQLQYLFNTTTGSLASGGCTVHFPSNFDPSDPNHTFDASTLAGYPTFGGDANYIHLVFDLPATE